MAPVLIPSGDVVHLKPVPQQPREHQETAAKHSSHRMAVHLWEHHGTENFVGLGLYRNLTGLRNLIGLALHVNLIGLVLYRNLTGFIPSEQEHD